MKTYSRKTGVIKLLLTVLMGTLILVACPNTPTPEPPFVGSQLQLLGSTSGENDRFGETLAINGDYAIVGAPINDAGGVAAAGAAYIFKRNASGWEQEAALNASDKRETDFFGGAVDIDGDYAIVAAPFVTVNELTLAGAVYVFKKNDNNVWLEDEKLTAAGNARRFASFGASVAIDGEYVLVGAPGADVGDTVSAGAAYIFKRSASNWEQKAKLTPSDGATQDFFGGFVALGGSNALVSAPKKDTGDPALSNAGAAYVFRFMR